MSAMKVAGNLQHGTLQLTHRVQDRDGQGHKAPKSKQAPKWPDPLWLWQSSSAEPR